MPKLSQQQKAILQKIKKLAPQRRYWNEIGNAAVYELDRLGAGPITGGAKHYDPDKAKVSRIGRQLVAICQMCENASEKLCLRLSALCENGKKLGIPREILIGSAKIFKQKGKPRKPDFDNLRALLHEGPSHPEAIELLRKQIETASNREADLIWNSIQALEGKKAKPGYVNRPVKRRRRR
ncbi:MAG: hypothetical protein WC634_04040 [archaeon]